MDFRNQNDLLQLYDEPHGSEYFIIDHSSNPPTWYRLDGTKMNGPGPDYHPDLIMVAIHHGWTPEKLYGSPPNHLVELYSKARNSSGENFQANQPLPDDTERDN